MLLFFLTVLAGFFVEARALSLFLHHHIQSPDNFLFLILSFMHIVGTAAFAMGASGICEKYHFGNYKNWFIISFSLGFVFFIVGFIMTAAVIMFLISKRVQLGKAYEDYERYITYDYKPDEKHIDADNLTDVIDSRLELSPLVDVMSDNDSELRRGAVSIMERLPKKDAIRLLRLSLQDNNIEVRFYAALGLSRIEGEITGNILMAKEELERNPDSAVSHMLLANAYAEYNECGILDDVTARYYRGLAISEYYKVLAIEADNIEVLNSLANFEVGEKKYDSALAKFRRVCELDPYNTFANVGIIQILYETEHIRQAMDRAKEIVDKMPKTKGLMREIIEYWAS
jgi:tetratricopeptide (TPR) repeat protein